MAGVEMPLTPSSSIPGTPKCDPKGRRNQGYKRIRWREYDPGKKAANVTPDQFVQWQPPPQPQKDSDADEKNPVKSSKLVSHDRVAVARVSKPTSPPPSPLQPLPYNGTRDDPFTILPIKKTECVVQTMDYFVTICRGIKVEDSVVPGTTNPHLSLLLPFALQHSILFESIVAVCRASVLLALGKSAYEDPAFVHHRGNTLAALNSKLQSKNCTDDAALLTVTMLMTLEYLTGNQYGVHMHCKGLEQMLQLRGPLSGDSDSATDSDWIQFVRTGLTAYKALGSFVTGEAPQVSPTSLGFASETFEALSLDKPLSYPEKPFSEGLCIILSRLPRGFSDLSLTSSISEQMINTLASIGAARTQYDSTYTSKAAQSPFFTPVKDQSDADHDLQQMTIQNLLSALQRMSLMSPKIIESYLSFGLIAFLFQLRRLAPLNLFYDPILRQFIITLPHHSKPTNPEEQHTLIWASLSVAGVLALRVVSMPESHTVMDHALELYPEARKWARLEKILRSFFWTDAIGEHWKGVWETAMKRRELLLLRRKAPADVVKLDLPHPSPEWIRDHIKGAPREMHEMGQALGICPFRPRPSTTSID